jgi:hypothetical protein
MINGHLQRTKNSPTGIVKAGRKRLRLISIALALAATIPAAYAVIDPPQADDIDTAIKQAGFDPLVPPNRLRGPGALYEVEDGSHRKVCDVDPALLAGKLKSSPIPEERRQSLEKSGFSLSGKFVNALNARLGGDRVTAVEYTLADVSISEIDYGDLFAIEDNLLSQPNCETAVKRLLQAKRKVCPGYAALSATTSYRVHVRSELEADAKDSVPVINTVQQVIQENADSQLRIQSADELTGENLFYGIQLSRLCITPKGASEPSVLVQSPGGDGARAG